MRAHRLMELFVYNWFYTGYTVYGHCLDKNGKYRQVKITNFLPSCYVEGDTVPSSTVIPVRAEYRRMLSSRDVSLLRPFHQLYFRNGGDMEAFARQQKGKCYMADIPQVTTFLSQTNVDHVGWIRTGTTPNNIHKLDRIPPSSPRVMSFDIEVRSMDAGMPQPHRILDTVEMISVVVFGNDAPTSTYILHMVEGLNVPKCINVVCMNEIDMITRFFNMVKDEDPTVITGYNIYGFDLHYLISRLKLRLVEIPNVSRGDNDNGVNVVRVDWSSDAYGHNSYDRLVIGGRVILDMYLYFKRMKLDKYSLDFVSQKFLGQQKDDMPYATMAGAFASGDYDELRKVAEYCIKDSVLVMNLFDKVEMWIDACEIAKITKCSIEDIYTRGEQMKMVAQCVAECSKRNIVLQPQPASNWKPYEGAYVLEPVRGVYDGCSILDFQSLYPSIIIAYNICPSTYTTSFPASANKAGVATLPVTEGCHVVGKHRFRKEPTGLLPGMIERILDERKTVKAAMKGIHDKASVEYIVLDRRQNALKICANSVYGMMGFQKSRYFGHVGCAESVTTVGRELLATIVEDINHSYQVEVIYGDTDSCMLYHKDDDDKNARVALAESICNNITASLPVPMALKFETYCEKVILLTKKRYILVSDNKVSYKGVMNARRDYCAYAKSVYSNTLQMVADGRSTNDIASYIDMKVFMLLSGKVDVHDLVITKSLARKLNTYKVNQPHVVLAKRLVKKTGIEISAGTRLEYVYVTDPDKMVTPDEFAFGGYTVDAQFYVRKQLTTQIDDILSVLNMGNYVSNSW